MKIKFLKLGADVEAFVRDSRSDYAVPCIGIFAGSKELPLPIKSLGDGFAVQEDNVMVEYNIPAVSEVQEWRNCHLRMATWIEDYLYGSKRYHLWSEGSMIFKASALAHPQAQKIGCDPDYSVWTRSVNEVDPTHFKKGLRTAGGHIHVSFSIDGKSPEQHDRGLEVREAVIKAQDLFLGVPSLFMESESDARRRELYGKAGAFRPKEYGVEYRVLSNFWIRGAERMEWAFGQSKRAVTSIADGLKFTPALEKAIQSAINGRKMKIAENLVRNFDLDIVS